MSRYLTIAVAALALTMFALSSVLLVSCAREGVVAANGDGNLVVVRYGVDFGRCIGYCRADMTLDSAAATLVRSSPNSAKFPDKSQHRPLSQSDWSALASTADIDAMMALDSVIGCPNCADGGSEYLELRRGDRSKRIFFPYHDSLPTIGPFLTKVRAIYATFGE